MPLITDKFGKSSIPTDVAIATTVKTTRNAGVAVLEAIDLSKYAVDTPVFVVTYGKTTDPVTGVVTITKLRSWKALVNVGANTLTNLTIQPGYVDDIGNAVGDFIECIPTSAWENSLIDGILTSLNPDGTLRTSAVQTALGITNNPAVGWNVVTQALTYTGHNGNGEYTGTFNGDVTGFLQRGHKLLVPRVVAPPTQCMTFVRSSSQYAVKAAPATGLNSTTGHTIETELYLDSYGTTSQFLVSNYTAAGGVGLWITADGRIDGFFGNAGIYCDFTSVQTVPLKKWNHIAYVVTNPATKAGQLYLNGAPIPFVVSGSATSVSRNGSICLGRDDASAALYLDGRMGETRVWNVAQTQAQIQANMNVALTGAEANLAGLWQGNGNFNDKTTNANNLTSTNGAIATTLISTLLSAYANATEYLIVTKVGAFAAGVTPVTMFGGTDGHVPNAALGTIQYSNVKSPFGFPTGAEKWTLEYVNYGRTTVSTPTALSWYNAGDYMYIPTGEWEAGFRGRLGFTHAGAGYLGGCATLASTISAETNKFLTGETSLSNVSLAEVDAFTAANSGIENTAMTQWFLNVRPQIVNSTAYIGYTTGAMVVYAKSAYI